MSPCQGADGSRTGPMARWRDGHGSSRGREQARAAGIASHRASVPTGIAADGDHPSATRHTRSGRDGGHALQDVARGLRGGCSRPSRTALSPIGAAGAASAPATARVSPALVTRPLTFRLRVVCSAGTSARLWRDRGVEPEGVQDRDIEHPAHWRAPTACSLLAPVRLLRAGVVAAPQDLFVRAVGVGHMQVDVVPTGEVLEDDPGAIGGPSSPSQRYPDCCVICVAVPPDGGTVHMAPPRENR